MFSVVQIYSQNLVIASDTDCTLIIDGERKADLKANQPVTLPVSEGEHIILAVTPDSKFHFRDAIVVEEGEKYLVEILFEPKMEHQKRLKNKNEKRKNKIETYRKRKPEIIQGIAENMVLIKANNFKMGSLNGELDEKPVREVFLDDFYISKYEITQKQWMAIMENNPAHFFNCDNCPVENVNWYDAVVFCNRLSRLSGLSPCYAVDSAQTDTGNHYFYDHMKWTVSIRENANGYRLPTEAEWECAAANSTDYQYAGSNEADSVAWTLNNAGGSTHPVGQKKPNKKGLYDMSGNVWEWCFDWYSSDYYSQGEDVNPTGPEEGQLRVIRGGGWMSHLVHARVRNRDREGADNKNSFTGFRIVRDK